MIEHLTWRSLADQRSDTRLIMLYKISHELVAIPKTDIFTPPFRFSQNMHSLSYQIPPTRLQLRQKALEWVDKSECLLQMRAIIVECDFELIS